jgi:hypothetical protein
MTNWSEADLKALQGRRGEPGTVSRASEPVKAETAPTGLPRVLARGQMSVRKMNRTESAYNAHLWLLRHAGEVIWFDFEAVKLRLADDTFYIPDFIVMLPDGLIEFREVKGYMRDDAAVKLKVANAQFPFRFVIIRKNGDSWSAEVV